VNRPSGPQARWQAVNELIHELGEVRRRYEDEASRGTTARFATRRLHDARRALLRVADDAPEEVIAAAWGAIAAARETVAWTARARRHAASRRLHAAEVRERVPTERAAPALAPDVDGPLVARVLAAARRRRG
jgi:hypothetical protein